MGEQDYISIMLKILELYSIGENSLNRSFKLSWTNM